MGTMHMGLATDHFFTHEPCYRPSFMHGTRYWPSFTHGPLLFIRPSFTHGPGPGLLLHMGLYLSFGYMSFDRLLLQLPPSWCCRAGDPFSTVFHSRHYKSSAHGCTWTSWFYTMSAPFPVSSLQYLMRGRVSPIKVYTSDSSALSLGP